MCIETQSLGSSDSNQDPDETDEEEEDLDIEYDCQEHSYGEETDE